MNRAEVRKPGQDGVHMQRDEVGHGKGCNQKERAEKGAPAAAGRGCALILMGSHPMAKERAENGPPAVAGRAAAVAGSGCLAGREINLWSTRGGGEQGARDQRQLAEAVVKYMLIYVYALHI